ncbi:MAG: hypothetical protein KAZ98_00150 [Prevotella sp.]|nr:hypothetical protein [Prevotella sp.]
MKKLVFAAMACLMVMAMVTGCKDTAKNNTQTGDDSTEVADATPDSTVYGVCGESTAMHTLELITAGGDSIEYMIAEDEEGTQDVKGGLLVGDRLAVIEGPSTDGERVAKKVINLTTLCGKWTSIDKNFEIQEGGVVISNIKVEKNPWTSWKILNGHLVLNRDTFDITNLGSDSLYLENKEGIFVYKRLKN